MIGFKIKDTNNFMQNLLVGHTFDRFLFCEGEICTAVTFTMDGRINHNFFGNDETINITEDFALWQSIKPICYEIIKGKKVPTKMKLVFSLPENNYEKIIAECGMSISVNDIGGLYLHITYENNTIYVITGTSLNVFTMDKTLDRYWDNIIETFFQKHFEIEKNM